MRKLTDRPLEKNLAARITKYKSPENHKEHPSNFEVEKICLSSKQSSLSKDEEME